MAFKLLNPEALQPLNSGTFFPDKKFHTATHWYFVESITA